MKIIPSIKKDDSFRLDANIFQINAEGNKETIVANLAYEGGEMYLETRGRLPNRKNDFEDEEKEIRIRGVSRSEQFVAINPLLVGSGFSSSGVSTSKYFIPEMLINTDGEVRDYNKCSFELSNFPMWLGIKRLIHAELEEPEVHLKINQIESLKYEFTVNEEVVGLEFNPVFTSDIKGFEKTEIHHKTLIYIKPSKPKNKMWFNEMVQKIADLFTLLIGAPLEITYQNFYFKDLEDIEEMHKVEYYRRGFTDANHETLSYNEQLLFPYASIHHQLQTVIENWFKVVNDESKYTVMRLLLSNFYLKQYEESVFLNYMQGIEGYHRLFYGGGYIEEKDYSKDKKKVTKFIDEIDNWSTELKKAVKDRIIYGYEYSLEYRLQELMQRLDRKLVRLFFKEGEETEFIKEVKGLRNQLTHPNPQKSNEVKTSHISNLNTQLKILFMIFIYLELGLSSDAIVNALTNCTRYRNQLNNN